MGRQTSGREMNSTDSGIEAYRLEMAVSNDHEVAIRAALEAAIHVARRDFTGSIRDDLMKIAEDLDSGEDDLAEDGVASLIWYAKNLDDALPPELRL